ncbi:DivIVA domain-containing protein [bacterium]|nr:DivIVA domain-containing protein [bacterium]MBL7052338.1 DivIVA domain-containing protein [Candidatus Neomarinimicrobiota bacterium]
MKVSPIEVRQQKFKKAMLGYNRTDVDAYMSMVADALEDMRRELSATQEKFTVLQNEHDRLAQMEGKLKDTLLMTQEASETAVENSKREAKHIVEDAERKSRQMLDDVFMEKKRIEEEIARQQIQKDLFVVKMQNLLRSQKEILNLFEEETDAEKTEENLFQVESHEQESKDLE